MLHELGNHDADGKEIEEDGDDVDEDASSVPESSSCSSESVLASQKAQDFSGMMPGAAAGTTIR